MIKIFLSKRELKRLDEVKKQRGQGRKLKSLLGYIDDFIPFEETNNRYEHFHVPCSRSFINSPKTRVKIKTAFLRKWIETTEKFIENSKTMHLDFCKVVAIICEQDIWDSEIIIFYDNKYYDTFFIRNDECQTWTKVDSKNSFIKRHGINTDLSEICINQKYTDEDYVYNSFMWVYNNGYLEN